MSNVLRCVALTALIMSMSTAVSLAATPYEAPKGYKVLWVLTGSEPKLSLHNPHGIVREMGYVAVDETQDIDEFVRMSSRSGFSMANQE